jgi:hypothetical protein
MASTTRMGHPARSSSRPLLPSRQWRRRSHVRRQRALVRRIYAISGLPLLRDVLGHTYQASLERHPFQNREDRLMSTCSRRRPFRVSYPSAATDRSAT